MKEIKLSRPILGLRESFNVLRAMQAKEISGYSSQFVPKFEEKFAQKIGVSFALSVNSGTSALTLAVRALNLNPGDKVAVSALTNMATYFPVLQVGAIPVPVDIDPTTLNMNPSELEKVMSEGIKAIIIVHLYGLPSEMDKIMEISQLYKVPIIEDCAESLGAMHQGIQTGAFGYIGCFSFYANKIITTGEGGMVTTNDQAAYEQMKSLRSLGFGKNDKFLHESDGYNFRLSNIQAAVGFGQMGRLEEIIKMKRRVASIYNSLLGDSEYVQIPLEPNSFFSVFWMYTVILKDSVGLNAKQLKEALSDRGIESREGFTCYSDQHALHEQFGVNPNETPIASNIQSRVIYLPSSPDISRREIKRVVRELNAIIKSRQCQGT